MKTNTVSLTTCTITVLHSGTLRDDNIKNSLFTKSDARGPQNLCRHSVTYMKYDAWHGRELFYVNVRQNVHQVSFAAGCET